MVPLTTDSLGVFGGQAVETKVCLYSRSSRARMVEVDPMRTGLGRVSLPIEMTKPALYSRCAAVKSSIPIPCEGPDAGVWPTGQSTGVADAPAQRGPAPQTE